MTGETGTRAFSIDGKKTKTKIGICFWGIDPNPPLFIIENHSFFRGGVEVNSKIEGQADSDGQFFTNPKNINKIRSALVNGENRLLLHGPPGSGKTFAITKLLRENNYDTNDDNSGVDRGVLDAAACKLNKEKISSFIRRALLTTGILSYECVTENPRRKCLIIDNVQGDYARPEDRDTRMVIQVLIELLEGDCSSHNVLLVVVSDCIVTPEMKRLKGLMKQQTCVIEFKPQDKKKMIGIAKVLAGEMELDLSDADAGGIATEAAGDLRKLKNLLRLQQCGRSSTVASSSSNVPFRGGDNIFGATRRILSNEGPDAVRENLVAGREGLFMGMVHENYPEACKHKPAGRSKEDKDAADTLTMEEIADRADLLADIDVLDSQRPMNGVPGEEVRAYYS